MSMPMISMVPSFFIVIELAPQTSLISFATVRRRGVVERLLYHSP